MIPRSTSPHFNTRESKHALQCLTSPALFHLTCEHSYVYPIDPNVGLSQWRYCHLPSNINLRESKLPPTVLGWILERERFRCLILFHLYRTPTEYRGAVAFYWKSSASMDVDVDVECWGSRVQSTGHISAMQTSTLNSGTVHLLNTNQFSVFVFFFLLVIWVLHCSLFFFIIDWKSLFDVDI